MPGVDAHYYCADEFHRCWDGGGEGMARRYNPDLEPESVQAWESLRIGPQTPQMAYAKRRHDGSTRRLMMEKQVATLDKTISKLKQERQMLCEVIYEAWIREGKPRR